MSAPRPRGGPGEGRQGQVMAAPGEPAADEEAAAAEAADKEEAAEEAAAGAALAAAVAAAQPPADSTAFSDTFGMAPEPPCILTLVAKGVRGPNINLSLSPH